MNNQWIFKDDKNMPGLDFLCHNPEGWGPFSNARHPDFTPCFEDIVIRSIPSVYVLIAGMIRLHVLSKRKCLSKDNSSSKWYHTKMILLFVLLLLQIINFITTLNDVYLSSIFSNTQILIQGLNNFVMLFVVFLHHFENARSKVSSGVLLFYWLFEIISRTIKLRTMLILHQSSESDHLTLYLIEYILTIGIFILENISKSKSQQIMLDEEDAMDCPEDKTNIFGIITFSWITPLMVLGYKNPLVMDDLWNLKLEYEAENICQKFEKYWHAELQKKKPSLLRALFRFLFVQTLLAFIFRISQDILQFTQPMLLNELMGWVTSYLTDNPEPSYKGVFIAVGMFITSITQSILLHQYFQRTSVMVVMTRSALVTAIYKKAIVLSNTSRQQSTVGEIVNRMSVDAHRLQDFCQYIQTIWSSPFQIIVALFLLYKTMGPSTWAGVTVLVLAIPFNIFLSKNMKKYQNVQMKNKDSRVKLMNEILNGIKVLKLYAWETPFIEKINFIRNELELATLKKIGLLAATQNFIVTSIPFLVSVSTFTVYVLISNVPLTSQVAFVAISLFSLLRLPMNLFPNVISSLIEAMVSLRRIEDYLTSEEIDTKAIKREDYRNLPNWNLDIPLVEINDANFKWNQSSRINDLSDINLSVKKGSLTAIVGRVGSGKSTLISSILGDSFKVSGQVTIRGSIAYVPQQPWIMNATVRDNIIFGLRFDPIFYDQVLEACSLKMDLKTLSHGDNTEIGERGINLSGGQKARISLARALYARADIYLLDDPLSAVDAHVSRHLFDHVLGPTGLLKNKARILVTHAIAYLNRVDEVIMLRNGKIVSHGTYEKLMNEEGDLYKLVNEFSHQVSKEEEEIVENELEMIAEVEEETETIDSAEEHAETETARVRHHSTAIDRRASINSVRSQATLRRGSFASSVFKSQRQKRNDNIKRDGQLMTVEERAKGQVSLDVYKQYAKACSVVGVILILILRVFSQGAQVGSSVWIKYWSNSIDEGSEKSVWFYLGIFAFIGWSSTIFGYIQSMILWVYCGLRSARYLHSNMLESVIKSPMSFFDTTPLGRILNRFSKDQQTVDEVLPRTFEFCLRLLSQVIFVVLVISISTPLFLILVIPLTIIFLVVQKFYVTTSRELKRLDSIARSPIYSHFQETIQGVSTIRAYEQQRVFIYQNQNKLDYNQKVFFLSLTCNRWLAVRLEFIGSLIILGSSLFAVLGVLYGDRAYIDPGSVGLSVSYALTVTGALNMLIRSYSDIETNIVSVERVKEYIDLPREKYESPKQVDLGWPNTGKIEFKKYSTRYRTGLELCLRDLSLTVNPKEKIGIVGRTGAGKSSLSLALFRIIEAAHGSISIDDVDISTLCLFDLRSRLTIIPQDPVLFAGTVRDNLDPFGTHDDAQIWQALEDAHLKDYVSSIEGQLSGTVLEGGDNFSVGQRQLICLARALLRRTTVLILDEATAAIDVQTDSIIQETIRRKFADCTILTIAHRINTVMDSDRILVLDKGGIVEFDTPTNLIANQNSIFYSLSKEAGLVE